MKIQAITSKNQSKVNKAVKYLVKYNDLNDLRNIADDNDNMKDVSKYNRLCEDAFNKYLESMYYLPKNQQKVIEKLLA
jgi:hypothetical protein